MKHQKRIEAPEKQAVLDALAEKGYHSIRSIAEAVAGRENGHYNGKSVESIRVCLCQGLSGERNLCIPLKKELLKLCENDTSIASLLELALDSTSGEYEPINYLFRERMRRVKAVYQGINDTKTRLEVVRDLESVVRKYE